VKLAGVIALAVALISAAPGAARASDGLALRGYGTAVIDGVLSPGEWDTAGRYDFQANRSPVAGGGTVPATVFVMNDATNLYMALRVAVTTLDNSAFDQFFGPPGSNGFGPGNDILRVVPWAFEDASFQQSGQGWEWIADLAAGGTQDGTSSVRVNGDVAVFEVAHPLNSSDDLHDFSLTVPSHVDYVGLFQHCIAGSCAFTNYTPYPSKIVVVSGTHIPPDTSITSGPADGAEVSEYATFELAGTDDVAPPSEITFECKVDAQEWAPCETPFWSDATDEGWHTVSVRAFDDMLNVDPTPAERRWRLDTTSPSRPRVLRRGRTLHFSATDPGTPPGSIHFRCALDGKRLHACGSRFRVRAGRHLVRVRAVDPAGNESSVKIVRLAR
jgi:hypothetical protein